MRTLLIIYCFIFSIGAFSQSVNELKKRQEQTKKKIELTNKLLKETKNKQSSTVSKLTVLKKQISERENLIKDLNVEITLLDSNLSHLIYEKKDLERRLLSLKNDYAKMIYHAYFYRNPYDKYLFILSSESFNQAYRRFRYMQEYSEYEKEQSIKIQAVVDSLAGKEKQIVQTINEKDVVLKGKEQETKRLQATRSTQQSMLNDLTKKEKKLSKDLRIQQKQANELNAKIQELIAREIAEAERKAREKQRREQEAAAKAAAEREKAQQAKGVQKPETTSTASTTKPAATIPPPSIMTKEETLIAGGFEKNMGRLSMPVRGIITGRFGVHPHPVLKHVEVNNKGIYIQAEPNSDASAIYEGEVTQVFAIPGSNNAVIVKHGNYRTVYANLTTTYVKVGAKVTAKQKLGKIYVDSENDNKTELYFMVYKNSSLENPEKWLAK